MIGSPRPYDEANIQEAIRQSALAASAGHMPFGACLADESGCIIVTAQNQSLAAKKRGGNGDVTCHAEMELIRKACKVVSAEDRAACTLYTSTEPCVMCAGAIYWSGISRIVYGCSSEELSRLSGPGGFDIPLENLYAMARPGSRRMEVVGPLRSEEALSVHSSCGIWAGVTPCDAASKDVDTERFLFQSGIGNAAAASSGYTVPTIDMCHDRSDDEIALDLWEAAKNIGFFTIINHGIPQPIIDAVFSVSSDFFSQDMLDKQMQSPFSREMNSGYEYMAQVRPSTNTADQKESLQVTARMGCMNGRWPSDKFQNAVESLLNEAHLLACRILSLLEPLACPHVSPGTLASSHTLWGDDGQCTLRLLHYPPMDGQTCAKLTTPDEQGRVFWRAGPHTDWDNLTLLFQRVGQPGLECCANPRDDSKQDNNKLWTPINPVENGIAVNIGDMLARWSGHRVHSNLHRVRMPTMEECDPPTSRYSIAFFAQSDRKTLIQGANSAPITAGDYILSRIK
eukprot:CAMPEP_0176477324 /NCGR_PEP_ID=MMETSP0200_2-20121128/558_1 /TAXON_ID=947934 /ORGANISM="Chaetoceros sp., Strain GSL56" /LENGTH=511 /DNA_ID=CAMNT_0017873119 /DNA_START=180 /DNA_END=1712 /DNA_ORIENTATION=+